MNGIFFVFNESHMPLKVIVSIQLKVAYCLARYFYKKTKALFSDYKQYLDGFCGKSRC